ACIYRVEDAFTGLHGVHADRAEHVVLVQKQDLIGLQALLVQREQTLIGSFGAAGIACRNGLVHLRVSHHGALDGGQMIVRFVLGAGRVCCSGFVHLRVGPNGAVHGCLMIGFFGLLLILPLVHQADARIAGLASVVGVFYLLLRFFLIVVVFVVCLLIPRFAY